ncbi:MAG: ABC transporter ATP-binding protein [Cyanobacteria bacterium CRU_2_1]|nr:ABC transporter ATP-binding protein [Cyanobacteria bacterium RU_5_0]NJR60481.1 ABC transporter ATP-binding protein [Cyanobacteria bacterium CRU_2_1]
MQFKLADLIRNFLKTTRFWQDNYLLLREFKYFRWIAILAVVCSLIGAALEGVTVSVIASFLQGLTNPDEPPIQTGIHWFDVWFLATQASAAVRIYRLSGLILLAIWLRSGFGYLGQFYSRLTQLHLSDRIRKLIFEQLQRLSLSFYSKTRAGELVNSMTSEAIQLQQSFAVVSDLLTRGSTLLAYVIVMFCLSWQLSIISVMAFSLLSVGLSVMIARVREASFEISKASGQFASVVIEFINGIRTIHASTTQDFERRRFYTAVEQMMQAKIKVAVGSESVKPIAEGVSSTVLIVIVVVAFNLFIVNGELRSASLLTFMFVLFRMMPLVSQVNQSRANFSSFQGSLGNIKKLLSEENKPYLKNGKIQFTGLNQSIDFVSVDFGYDVEESVLHNITLSVTKGQTTALVGASGAGKTTLVDLIPRFYDPTQGQILIDGIDLRELEINSLRQRMAVVSQDAFIFNTSVRNNIAYGVEKIDDDAVYKAARLANAWEFIQEMPDGLDTKLGDRGVRLSGGQRQRIAIARAILRNPEILILDEATSALDSVTERLIQESLDELSTGRTVIAIAHRLSTIVRADKVVVLEHGRIVEQGGYQELLEQRGKLWNYHQMQYELGRTI